jgi:hypothetical protein
MQLSCQWEISTSQQTNKDYSMMIYDYLDFVIENRAGGKIEFSHKQRDPHLTIRIQNGPEVQVFSKITSSLDVHRLANYLNVIADQMIENES